MDQTRTKNHTPWRCAQLAVLCAHRLRSREPVNERLTVFQRTEAALSTPCPAVEYSSPFCMPGRASGFAAGTYRSIDAHYTFGVAATSGWHADALPVAGWSPPPPYAVAGATPRVLWPARCRSPDGLQHLCACPGAGNCPGGKRTRASHGRTRGKPGEKDSASGENGPRRETRCAVPARRRAGPGNSRPGRRSVGMCTRGCGWSR